MPRGRAEAVFTFSGMSALEGIVGPIAAAYNERLLALMLRRFGLMQQCRAIKNYLLLAQGDFIQALMEKIKSALCMNPKPPLPSPSPVQVPQTSPRKIRTSFVGSATHARQTGTLPIVFFRNPGPTGWGHL